MADFQHQSLVESLTAIAPITLAEMDAIKLMNRVDTKYLTDEATLVQVLADAAAAGYRALETEGEKLSPYAYVELRNVFNDPACTAKYDGSSFIDYVFTGYTDTYVNRLRGALGLEWKLSKQHALDFSFLGDYCYDKVVDTNAEGTKLKSIAFDRAFNASICIGYKFSF